MMLVTALAPTDAAAAACALSILNCGCTINAPGNYTLSGASPMNSTGTCINITASNVTLSSSGIVIKGPGPVPGTIGVYIAPTANRVLLEGIEAEDFRNGVRVDGPNASLILVETTLNGKGVVVNGANAYLIEVISFLDNEVGIQINASATDFVGVVVEAAGLAARENGDEDQGAHGGAVDMMLPDLAILDQMNASADFASRLVKPSRRAGSELRPASATALPIPCASAGRRPGDAVQGRIYQQRRRRTYVRETRAEREEMVLALAQAIEADVAPTPTGEDPNFSLASGSR